MTGVQPRRRRAISIGVPTFGVAPGEDPFAPAPLPFVHERVPAVTAALRRFDYTVTECLDPAHLSGAALPELIWREAEECGPDGLFVVHIISHGVLTDDGALYVVGADGRHHPEGQVTEWIRRFGHFPHLPAALFLLDLCHAGAAARQPWHLSTADGAGRAWVIAASAPHQQAFRGRYSAAVANVLTMLAGADAHTDAEQRHLPLERVAAALRREVRRLVARDGALPQEVTGSLWDIAAGSPDVAFFPNPGFLDGGGRRAVRASVDVAVAPFLDDVDEALDPVHFMDVASGMKGHHGRGCFSGRSRELRALTAWCDGHGEPWLRVVTGGPGAGKSAIIGVIVCAAHHLLNEPTRRIWDTADWAPRVNRHLAAVHARQRGLAEIVASLASQLALTPPDGRPWEVPELVAGIGELDTPPVIVLDALDEAEQHQQVMSKLLLPLAGARRPDGRPACRLLVGMRPWPEFAALRELAEGAGGLIDLDAADRWQLERDIERYVDTLLRYHPPYDGVEYAGARASFAHALAATLVHDRPGDDGHRDDGHRWGEFLVAGLYTYHFVAAYDAVADNVRARELAAAVPRTLPDLLDLDLSTRPQAWLRPVLTALAHARGDGMPADVIQDAAAAFAPAPDVAADGPSPQAQRRRITEALDAGRFYLRVSADVDGTTLYRLFHQGLSDHLRRSGGGPAQSARLAEAMLAPLTSMAGVGRRWDLAEPYLRRHAVTHCAESGRLDLLADDPEFLVHGEPQAVAELMAAHQLPWLSPDGLARLPKSTRSRRYALAVTALLGGEPGTARALCHPPGQPPLDWVPGWAVPAAGEETVGLRPAGLLVDAPTEATALVRWRGQLHICVVTTHGSLTVWRAADLAPLWSAQLGGHPRSLHHRGRVVVVEDGSGRVYGWEVATGRPAPVGGDSGPTPTGDGPPPPPAAPSPDSPPPDSPPPGPTARVATESGPILLAADPRGGIRLLRHDGWQWIPAGWQPTRHPVTALAGIAVGPRLTIVRVEGADVVVTSHNLRKEARPTDAGHLLGRLSDGATPTGDDPRPAGTRSTGDTRLSCALAGRDLLVLAEGERAQAWWLRADRATAAGPLASVPAAGPLTPVPAAGGHLVSVVATAVGEPRVATGTVDGRVLVRDAATGAVVGACHPHRQPVSALAFAARGLLVSASESGDLAVTDPATGRTEYHGLTGHDGRVESVALTPLGGRPVALSAAADGIRVTDLRSRYVSPLATPVAPEPDGCGQVEHIVLPDGGRATVTWRDTRLFIAEALSERLLADIDLGAPVDGVTLVGPDLAVRCAGRVVLLAARPRQR
ncbi:hypothetical protein ACH4OY_24785 [Micromonospora rubida]|uniref:Caspase domain-containing protein n=1 Tax=Micromonospora rubida TaxID=2697657 RepID=A0ABW7SQ89_9ACTN